MAVVGVDSSSPQVDSGSSCLVGLVSVLTAIWHCSTFIKWTGELSQWLCHNDSTINIVPFLLLFSMALCFFLYLRFCTADHRLKELLRNRLIECGWRDELKQYCKGKSAYHTSAEIRLVHTGIILQIDFATSKFIHITYTQPLQQPLVRFNWGVSP